MLPPFAIQRVKKCHQIVFLLIRQLERNDQRILVRILHASLIIKVYDFFQSFEAAVMRIRCASGDLPQGRGFECADVLRILCYICRAFSLLIMTCSEARCRYVNARSLAPADRGYFIMMVSLYCTARGRTEEGHSVTLLGPTPRRISGPWVGCTGSRTLRTPCPLSSAPG